MRARTNVKEINADLLVNLAKVREALDLNDPDTADAFAHVETFCAIAVRVLAKTNPSKVRDEARTVEIQARMDGKPVDLD